MDNSLLGPGQYRDKEGGHSHTPQDLDQFADPEALIDPDGPSVEEQIQIKLKGELARREQCRRDIIAFAIRFAPMVAGEPYIPGWVHRDIGRRLMRFMRQVEQRERPRLILLMPPRHGKSLLTSILFTAWVLGHHPEWRIMNVGYNEDLPVDFSKAVRDVLSSKAYQLVFMRTRIAPGDRSASDWATSNRGGMRAAGLAGGITGHGAHIMEVDDPLKGAEEASSQGARDKLWEGFVANVRTRIQPGGGVFVIQTWWNDDDLAGRLQKLNQLQDEMSEFRDHYEIVSYPAVTEENEYEYYDRQTHEIIRRTYQEGEIPYTEEELDEMDYDLLRLPQQALHEERYSYRELMAIKADVSDRVWSALFQQNPIPDSGIFFKREHIKLYPELPPAAAAQICTGWDFAIGEKKRNNFTCGVSIQQVFNGTMYVRNVRKFKGSANVIIRAMVEEALTYLELPDPPYYTIAVEDGHIWRSIKDSVRTAFEEANIPFSIITEYTPVTDKEARATPVQDKTERGQFRVLAKAAWAAGFIREFMKFPSAKDADQVDASAWSVRRLLELGPPRQKREKTHRPRDRYVDSRFKSWKDRIRTSTKVRGTHMSS